jgi:hypothetical protein
MTAKVNSNLEGAGNNLNNSELDYSEDSDYNLESSSTHGN